MPGEEPIIFGPSEADFDSVPGGMQMSEAGVNVPIPISLGEKVSAWTGVRFRYNQLEFTGSEPFRTELAGTGRDLDLYRFQVPINLWINRNEKWDFWLRAEPGLHTDFEDVSGDDFVFTSLALASYKWSPGFRIAFGGYYSSDVGEELLLPVLGFIWQPNPQLILSGTFPVLYASYKPQEGLLFSAFAYPAGASWNLTDPETGRNFDLEYTNIRAGISVEKSLFGPFWGYVEGGYQFYQSAEIGGPEF